MKRLIPAIIGHNIGRSIGRPLAGPFNLTISVTGRCNSRCKTCNIWKSKSKDLSAFKWRKILASIGKSPLWITISGGEPFMRSDLVEIVRSIVDFNRPSIMTIATNGTLNNTVRDVRNIREIFKGKLIVNLSIDGVGASHDEIRGIKCSDKIIRTYKGIRNLAGVYLGVHTVISKHNVSTIKDIKKHVEQLNPDSYISQIAENRIELDNTEDDLVPEIDAYLKAVKSVKSAKINSKNISLITKQLRTRYYRITERLLKTGKGIPCYAGVSSAHVNYNGDLWACCVKCEKMGNLMKDDFETVWKSDRAREIRKRIKDDKCYCTMANACYSNILCAPISIFK